MAYYVCFCGLKFSTIEKKRRHRCRKGVKNAQGNLSKEARKNHK